MHLFVAQAISQTHLTDTRDANGSSLVGGRTSLHLPSGVPAASGFVKRGNALAGAHRAEGVWKGLAGSINNPERPRGRRAVVAVEDLLALPDLQPALFVGGTLGMQTLDKYRILLGESGETSLEDGHER